MILLKNSGVAAWSQLLDVASGWMEQSKSWKGHPGGSCPFRPYAEGETSALKRCTGFMVHCGSAEIAGPE